MHKPQSKTIIEEQIAVLEDLIFRTKELHKFKIEKGEKSPKVEYDHKGNIISKEEAYDL